MFWGEKTNKQKAKTNQKKPTKNLTQKKNFKKNQTTQTKKTPKNTRKECALRRHLQQDPCLEPYSLVPLPTFFSSWPDNTDIQPQSLSQLQSFKFGEMLQT